MKIYTNISFCLRKTISDCVWQTHTHTHTHTLLAILNKSWRQHPTRYQLYVHLPPITKTIQVGQTRHTGHCWRSRDELISDVLGWTPTYGRAKHDDQLEHIFSSYVSMRDVPLRTWRRRWTIGRSGERRSGISVLVAWHDDDEDIYWANETELSPWFAADEDRVSYVLSHVVWWIYIYIYIYNPIC